MSDIGGTQSLVAVGSDGWMADSRDMLTVLTRLDGMLQSVTIDNTGDCVRPSNVFPLNFSMSNTPVLPIAGAVC